MQVKHASGVTAEPMEGSPGVTLRWLRAAPDGAPSFALRLIEVEPGASTPYHSHAHEHEVFVLSGEGVVNTDQGELRLSHASTVFVPGGDLHQFRNTGDVVLRFICLIPLSP